MGKLRAANENLMCIADEEESKAAEEAEQAKEQVQKLTSENIVLAAHKSRAKQKIKYLKVCSYCY